MDLPENETISVSMRNLNINDSDNGDLLLDENDFDYYGYLKPPKTDLCKLVDHVKTECSLSNTTGSKHVIGDTPAQNGNITKSAESNADTSSDSSVENTICNGCTDDDDDFSRSDVINMIDKLLEDNSEETPIQSMQSKSDQETESVSSSSEDSSLNNSKSNRPSHLFSDYRPPRNVQVQISCNGKKTVTSTSLQDFRRLIGLRDSPRRSDSNNSFRISNPNHSNSTYAANNHVNGAFERCAIRNGLNGRSNDLRSGNLIQEKIRLCFLELGMVSEIREKLELDLKNKNVTRTHRQAFPVLPPINSRCFIDQLIFEYLKEYCHTNYFLKQLEETVNCCLSPISCNSIEQWLLDIHFLDERRRAGFCECKQSSYACSELDIEALEKLTKSTGCIRCFLAYIANLFNAGVFTGSSK